MASAVEGTAKKVTQDSWRLPVASREEPKLKVYNSLTRSKVEFVTKVPGIVTWYNCGPTVYDASHMGHARNYMAQDIMRRILRDYFGYEVQFVMNITDVDDKIILRARQQYLLKQYTSQINALTPNLLGEVESAWTTHFFKSLSGALSSPPADTSDYKLAQTALHEIETSGKDLKWIEAQKLRDEKFGMYLTAVTSGLSGLKEAEKALQAGQTGIEEAHKLIESNTDALSLWLDKKLGSTVTDPAIFRDLAAFWENSFFESMSALRVERPTTLTRVSEYIPEIVEFVEGIINRGLGYESGGSVWFNTTEFEGKQGEKENLSEEDSGWKHTYAKLQPWSKGNRELLEDGEGSLTSGSDKRSAADFALWKASKPGEPAWPSPWGNGRPGWHIECSVMASAVLGTQMDVHSGGVDLAFPHHDNEIAQSEAYHNCRQWVNYFLHTGHLHIQGLKMSKSLKNFVTIDEALRANSARELRFCFLLQTWNAKLDFKPSLMHEVKSAINLLNNFFAVVSALNSEFKANLVKSDGKHHFEQPELEIFAKLSEAQYAFRVALCDSFDTPKALQILLDLVSVTNIYLAKGRNQINVSVVLAVSEWVTRMLRMFGLGGGAAVDSQGEKLIGWGTVSEKGENSAANRDEILLPYLRALSSFRDRVRSLAMQNAPASEILALSDQLRDSDLIELGVALDDQEDGKALVKLVDPQILRDARDAKLAAAEDKIRKKEAAKLEAERKRLEKLEKGKLDPMEMFKGEKGTEFGSWDEFGIPLTDKEGIELPKSRRKKLQKEFDAQKKLHDEYLKENAAST